MIIDSHTHFTTPGVMNINPSMENMLETLDRFGIDAMISAYSPATGFTKHSDKEGYVEVCHSFFERSNGRVYNYFCYNPAHADFFIGEIEKYHDEEYMTGIKLHSSSSEVFADDESFRPAFEAAKKYNMPVMAHTWALTSNPKQKFAVPELFEKWLAEYPDVNFIFGHSGGRINGIKKALELGEQYKNAYFDISGDVLDRRLVEIMVSRVGANKILFGSDNAWFDPSVQMGLVLGADISLEEKTLILGDNAARLFKIEE